MIVGINDSVITDLISVVTEVFPSSWPTPFSLTPLNDGRLTLGGTLVMNNAVVPVATEVFPSSWPTPFSLTPLNDGRLTLGGTLVMNNAVIENTNADSIQVTQFWS